MILNNLVKLTRSKRIKDYKEVLEQLTDDFGYVYYHSILHWCGIIENPPAPNIFWQVYLIKYKGKTVGITGLYATKMGTKELWLGWFGIFPAYRNKKIGAAALSQLENLAGSAGCKTILSYVEQAGKALPFYYRNGYKRYGYAKTFIRNNPHHRHHFDNDRDHIIYKNL
jgi:GNAT superfamily N-acetyltransferase